MLCKTKATSSNRENEEELPRKEGGIKTDRDIVAVKNLSFHNFPQPAIKAGRAMRTQISRDGHGHQGRRKERERMWREPSLP